MLVLWSPLSQLKHILKVSNESKTVCGAAWLLSFWIRPRVCVPFLLPGALVSSYTSNTFVLDELESLHCVWTPVNLIRLNGDIKWMNGYIWALKQHQLTTNDKVHKAEEVLFCLNISGDSAGALGPVGWRGYKREKVLQQRVWQTTAFVSDSDQLLRNTCVQKRDWN